MFDRRHKPNKQNAFAAGAALLLVASIFAAPALAATPTQIDCPGATEATLDIPAQVLATELLSHDEIPAVSIANDEAVAEIEELELTSTGSLLAPRAEAAIRHAFDSSSTEPMAGTESKSEPATDDEEHVEAESGMNTRLPGISDADFSRYKKQMYRRDI